MPTQSPIEAAALCFALAMTLVGCADPPKRPNVLFIAIDDMNHWIRLLDAAAPIRTPNLERLADRGMLFTRAYAPSAACNPSRVAVLTGLRPSTTGVYGNQTDWRRVLPDAVTLPAHFMANGYRVAGAGKIFHHHLGGAFHDDASFHDFLPMPDPPDAPMPSDKLNGLEWYGSPNTDWGVWPPRPEDSVDWRTATYAAEFLAEHQEQPFFLAVGIFRPHMPFFAPQEYFDAYPEKSLVMPERLDEDLDDIPSGGRALLDEKKWFWEGMTKAGAWREAVRAYQAAATFADAQVGRVLDALDASGLAESTIVVLWSDHGYHLGEKDHWEKFVLWEQTTHVPFIVVAPGTTPPGSRCDRPVDLTAIYPTLIELCSLPEKPELDGTSIAPLLQNPQTAWEQPGVMTYGRGNHAVRTERWRYIRYADGSEELYDHTDDPLEWRNVAADPQHAGVISTLARWLPVSDAPAAPPLKRPE